MSDELRRPWQVEIRTEYIPGRRMGEVEVKKRRTTCYNHLVFFAPPNLEDSRCSHPPILKCMTSPFKLILSVTMSLWLTRTVLAAVLAVARSAQAPVCFLPFFYDSSIQCWADIASLEVLYEKSRTALKSKNQTSKDKIYKNTIQIRSEILCMAHMFHSYS